MKLSDKVNYFYNDIYEFIELLKEANIIKAEAGSLILNKLSQTFSNNIAFAEDYSKEYKRIDFSKEIERLKTGSSLRDNDKFTLSDAVIEETKKHNSEIDYSNLPKIELDFSVLNKK